MSEEKQEEKETKKAEKKEKQLANINEHGAFTFTNQEELALAAALMIRTKSAPSHLAKEGNAAVAAALMLCKQFKLPQKAMNQMAYIKGKLTVYGSLVTALVERHPRYGSKKEFFVDIDFNEISVKNKNLDAVPYAAVVQIKKLGDQHWSEYFFTMDDARAAGLDEPKKSNGQVNLDSPWIKYVKDMLKHKTRKRAYDAEFASAIEGIEYHEDVAELQVPRDVTSSVDIVEGVNNDFADVDESYKVAEVDNV